MNSWDDCARLIIRYAFIGKPIGAEEFLNRMVGALGTVIDAVLKEDLIKWKAKT